MKGEEEEAAGLVRYEALMKLRRGELLEDCGPVAGSDDGYDSKESEGGAFEPAGGGDEQADGKEGQDEIRGPGFFGEEDRGEGEGGHPEDDGTKPQVRRALANGLCDQNEDEKEHGSHDSGGEERWDDDAEDGFDEEGEIVGGLESAFEGKGHEDGKTFDDAGSVDEDGGESQPGEPAPAAGCREEEEWSVEQGKEFDEDGSDADHGAGADGTVGDEKKEREGQKDGDDDVVLTVDSYELEAEDAGEVEEGAGAEFLLGEEAAADAKPDGEKEELRHERDEHDGERVGPEPDEKAIEVGVERGVTGSDVAIGQETLEDARGLVPVKGRDVAAWRRAEKKEETGEEAETAEDKSPDGEAVELRGRKRTETGA